MKEQINIKGQEFVIESDSKVIGIILQSNDNYILSFKEVDFTGFLFSFPLERGVLLKVNLKGQRND